METWSAESGGKILKVNAVEKRLEVRNVNFEVDQTALLCRDT